jgi:hypothetical protein
VLGPAAAWLDHIARGTAQGIQPTAEDRHVGDPELAITAALPAAKRSDGATRSLSCCKDDISRPRGTLSKLATE